MSLWGVGGGVVLLLAGMKGIPPELYEAASIDGASSGQSFFSITFPMLTPVIFFNLITGIAWVLFIIILVLTLIVFRSSALWVHYEEGKENG
ncbi:L-arabinose transport system permease protein AraP [compost metagenome]